MYVLLLLLLQQSASGMCALWKMDREGRLCPSEPLLLRPVFLCHHKIELEKAAKEVGLNREER